MNPDRLYANDFAKTEDDGLNDSLRDLRFASPRYGSSQTNSPRTSSPMIGPNRPASQPILSMELENERNKKKVEPVENEGEGRVTVEDGKTGYVPFPSSNLRVPKGRLADTKNSKVFASETPSDSSVDGSVDDTVSQNSVLMGTVEPLGNTAITYDHDEAGVDLRRLNVKFDSMTLDTKPAGVDELG
jgi:hypothetical protein